MIDKLIVLSAGIEKTFAQFAREIGRPQGGYEKFVDLRNTPHKLPVRLYYKGRHNGINKVDVIDVAKLGLTRTEQVLRRIVANIDSASIYRIDACLDLPDVSTWDFGRNCHIPKVQNFRLYRSRGAVSIYLQSSKYRTVLLYDKGRQLRKEGVPLGRALEPGENVTRFEVQLTGEEVPYKKFRNLRKYTNYDWVGNLEFRDLKLDTKTFTATQRLAAEGLRHLISELGLQTVAKSFSPPEWASIKKKYLEPMQATQISPIRLLLKKSITRWMQNQIYHPRLRAADDSARAGRNARP